MTSPYKMYETDKEIEQRGVKLQFPGFSITIARAGGANKRFAATLTRKLGTRARAFEAGLMDEAESTRILAEVYAESVVLGWEGVVDRDGSPIPFSKEACVKLLTELPDLFADVREESIRLQNFRLAQREEDAGN